MSTRTITALYGTREAAESAKQRLMTINISPGAVDIHDEGSVSATDSGGESGLFGGLKNMFGHHDDTHTYAEGIKRGHFLLTAKVDEEKTDAAIEVLETTGAADVDQLRGDWEGAGWTPPSATYAGQSETHDEAIPIVEERLVVGKREVERGGVRVRSYVVETPVSEQVSLRQENVSIERRPVDRAVTSADDAFRDRTVEMTETAEEAVVGKQATIREELTIKKDVSQRTEEINDTVRHTEVDVERLPGTPSTLPGRGV